MLVSNDVIVLDSPKIGGPVSGGQTTQSRLALRSALGTLQRSYGVTTCSIPWRPLIVRWLGCTQRKTSENSYTPCSTRELVHVQYVECLQREWPPSQSNVPIIWDYPSSFLLLVFSETHARRVTCAINDVVHVVRYTYSTRISYRSASSSLEYRLILAWRNKHVAEKFM